MTTAQPELTNPTALPCVNSCARRGTEKDDQPEILGARHGRFCDRCFHSTRAGLRLAPTLAGHIANLIGTPASADESEISVQQEAPLPFNTSAFDDVNGIYEELVRFAGLFAVRLKVTKPPVALNAWRTPTGRVKGFTTGVSSWSAQRETAFIARWLDDHLEAIFSSAFTDEYVDVIDYFIGEARYFRSLDRKWPRQMTAAWSRMPHTDGVTCCWPRRIAIFPAETEGGTRTIRCDGCGHIWTEDEYSAAVLAYNEEQQNLRRPGRGRDHLIRKYVTPVPAEAS
ncbi:hypothetical protein [Rathayibacter sp. AY1B8]|uniref:hypothetical protein n=1 Tax=Rathayibacter sp. AY1B8 TaxID=2080533 RepID=UPI000CE92077|nr:hypothetical protein [Rathayibacter sp. AY1B8]PPI08221.1 hypothetical protein C5C63_04510 [Rathayibacter sp. AY1B8]